MRTNVIVKSDVNQSAIKKGDMGYIDGYVQAADGRAYAVVVVPSKKIIDMVPIYLLEPQGIE